MSSTQELIMIGKEFGYSGKELETFVRDTQAQERKERFEERDKEKEKIEREKEEREKWRLQEKEEREKSEEKERERLELEKQRLELEKHKIELERQRAAEDYERSIRLAEIQHRHAMELAEKEIGALSAKERGKGPKLPWFDENKDNMDSYLSRFERYAEAQGWEKKHWCLHLSALLKGKALDVYSRLPSEESLDYDILKAALLKRFELTEEGFKKRFKTARPEKGETFVQYLSRSKRYLEQWFELGSVAKTYDGVVDYLLRDQLLAISNKEMYLFLKEKRITDGSEMAIQADLFAEARGGCRNVVLSEGRENVKVVKDQRSEIMRKQFGSSSREGNTYFARVRCGYCKGDHKTSDCKKRGIQHRVATVDDSELSEFGRVESGNVQRYNSDRGSWNQRSQRSRGRSRYRGYNPGGMKRTDSSSCITDEDSSVQLGACWDNQCPTKGGQVNGKRVQVMRDTGATCVVVDKRFVLEHQFLGKERRCKFVDGSERCFPVAKIDIDTPYFVGSVEALCMESPLYDLVLGNVEGARFPDPGDVLNAVQTRAQISRENRPYRKLNVPGKILNITKTEFRELQLSDETLARTRVRAEEGQTKSCKGGGQVSFVLRNNLLYRMYETKDNRKSYQLVVPKKCRESVMKLAHEALMAGHLGIRKTSDRVLAEFYWPGVCSEVSRYCRSCDICQRTLPKGKIQRVPLGNMPLIETPFKRVAIDIVGPIEPMTDRKNRYILVMVDYATRYPEAVALPSIETERVAEALVDMFSRLGIPEEMLTDMGSQFTSKLMSEVSRLLSLQQLTTTPYHPICNGLVEKFNGTLKQMLRRMCSERPKDWDKYINAALFAYREVPQESLGFSPFELLYGRTVRGPVSILKELWSGEVSDGEVKSTYQYVIDLRERLEETCKMAQEQLGKAKLRQKKHYNQKSKKRSFVEGSRVLVLLPVNQNKLLLQWKGPFTVTKVVNQMDYRIDMNGKQRTFHANMLKRYNERKVSEDVQNLGILAEVSAAVVEEERDIDQSEGLLDVEIPLECPTRIGQEDIKDVEICKELTTCQRKEIENTIKEFGDVLTDIPGTTSYIEHDIQLNTNDPFRCKGYPIPYQSVATVEEEVKKMLELGVIESSKAPFSSPVVMLRKKDGSIRFCIDFRQLNRVTVFDAEPMPNAEEIFSKLSEAKYFSKIDLSKGYWQVPLTERAKDLTSFETPKGLFRFKKMPFGLVCASSTFNRLMRKVLLGLDCAISLIDDILIYTSTWEQHVVALQEVLSRLRVAGLTARPKKCSLGFCRLEFLGHMLGETQTLLPVAEKVEAIQKAERPVTKKQVRSFLGVVGFYRKFIPNFSAIAVPLTDLTKKGKPNKVSWEESHENAFQALKRCLVGPPILRLPQFDKPFILRTDASDTGLGAILLQGTEGEEMPVAYASKKLLDREKNYSVIEKECLAVVWGVSKFHRYLFGKEFILETDHQPLTYLNKSKMANSRLMRWALALQPYRMRIRSIRGKDNVGADYLSRVG